MVSGPDGAAHRFDANQAGGALTWVNAATAARDTRWLAEHGYKAVEVQPVDLFPRTKHVECVVKLTKDVK